MDDSVGADQMGGLETEHAMVGADVDHGHAGLEHALDQSTFITLGIAVAQVVVFGKTDSLVALPPAVPRPGGLIPNGMSGAPFECITHLSCSVWRFRWRRGTRPWLQAGSSQDPQANRVKGEESVDPSSWRSEWLPGVFREPESPF